jgi:hypothetical protein
MPNAHNRPHVFIVQADLPRLKTDAWLLPCDAGFNVLSSWIPVEYQAALRRRNTDAFVLPVALFDEWTSGQRRTVRHDDWPGHSMPWLTNVGGGTNYEVDWYLEAVSQFVEVASDWAKKQSKRSRPLLGIPAVGTGYGGQWHKKAGIIDALFDHLVALADQHDVDLVFTLFDPQSFAAAQLARKRRVNAGTFGWDLDSHLLASATALAERAKSGSLVMFLGSGVSVGAGLPTWRDFLGRLADKAGLTESELEALQKLDAMDAGSIVERFLGGREALERSTRELLDTQECSLQHALIASIPHEAAVTLNYDTLYETASKVVVGDVAVLPQERNPKAKRWLLKLHGCVQRGDLVLTRTDYLRFGERRAALAGIVQALLITKHMLFIGFGMTDPNFLRILDDVRRSLGDVSNEKDVSHPIGTVLMLNHDPLRNLLFDADLKMESMGSTHAPDSARQLEIFLDLMAFKSASTTAFFFDPTYDALLSAREREFRDALQTLHKEFADDRPENIWAEFENLVGINTKE